VLFFPVGDDATPRAYTTSPSSLAGFATVSGDEITDTSQDWSAANYGELLTFTEGPNAGTYRLKTLVGNDGGPIGAPYATGPADTVRIAPSILRIQYYMPESGPVEGYSVTVDRLGIQEPHLVTGEDVSRQFLGTGDPIESFLTAKGPLVTGCGDAEPANRLDVEVFVNGTQVDVGVVNPYIGEITLSAPVVSSNPPPEVLVNYKWFASPIFPMVLNTPGSVLNKWDRNGGMPTGPRFPMAVTLGAFDTEYAKPVLIGHRFLGFEREYSALLNSPTTLLLNMSPERVNVPGFERDTAGLSVAYEATEVPTAATPPWDLKGTDGGQVNINEGTYTVVDQLSGGFSDSDPTAVVYSRDEDLTFRLGATSRPTPAAVNAVGRFAVSDDDLLSPDGVFTGVGFGFHDNYRLYLAGALLVNEVQHVGLLLDAENPDLVASWSIGPNTQVEITDFGTGESNEVVMTTAEIPPLVAAGDRFQIFAPENQEGVYTIASVVHQTDGTSTITIEGAFPENPGLFGNKYPVVHFEVLWADDPTTPGAVENQTTYRIVADPSRYAAQLLVSGGVSGTVADLEDAPTFPQPADTSLLLSPTEVGGGFFWGSLSWRATNRSTWSFFRYGATPDVATETGHLFTVENDMTVVPEDDTGNEWYATQTFGLAQSIFSYVRIETWSAHPTLDLVYGYERIEPFLTPRARLDLRTTFHMDFMTSGKDPIIVINDTRKEVRLAPILYWEDAPGSVPFRQIVYFPTISYTGLLDPVGEGWSETTAGGWSAERHQKTLRLEVEEDATIPGSIVYEQSMAAQLAALPFPTSQFSGIEARFSVSDYTADGADFVGMVFRGTTYDGYQLGLGLVAGATPKIRMGDFDTGVSVQEYNFDWTDGEPHEYRLVMATAGGADLAYLIIDGNIFFPTLTLSSFPGPVADQTVAFGAHTFDVVQTLDIDWRWINYFFDGPPNQDFTLGIWLGGDDLDIDNWELPRLDSSTAPNSSEVGPVIKEMYYLTDLEVRLYRDPEWGVTLYRPDIALPPYYVGDNLLGTVTINPGSTAVVGVGTSFVIEAPPGSVITVNGETRTVVSVTDASNLNVDVAFTTYATGEKAGIVGEGFAIETTEPSAGWINVEYANLPTIKDTFGKVVFGSTDRTSLTDSRWAELSYRLLSHPTEDYRAPQHMVLNYYHTIHSGEWVTDTTPETVIIQPVSNTEVSLLPTHLYADRIFKVLEEGVPTYTPDMFTFDEETQTITLLPDDEGQPRQFATVLTGTEGAFDPAIDTTLFTDTSADFSSILPGYVLHVTSGLSSGSYLVTEVPSPTTLRVAAAFPYESVGPVPWQITQDPQPVTVVFAAGNPVTNTYLEQQPLLDSTTLLNEGTPPYPKSQTAETDPVVIFGPDSADWRYLDVDTPADVQSDPWRVLSFREESGTYYEGMEFQELTDGGSEGLLSTLCEATILTPGEAGWSDEGGDILYSPTGTGPPLGGAGASANLFQVLDGQGNPVTIGSPIGGFVTELTGYQEIGMGIPKNELGGIPTVVPFIASGGGYVGPPINRVGSSIAVLEPVFNPENLGGSVLMVFKNTVTGAIRRYVFNG